MALALTAITISHFRSHHLLRLRLDQRPVAIHGPNGAGKTNILEAVSMFSPGRGMRRASAAEMTRRPEALGWKLSAEIVAGTQRHEIETWSEGGTARQVRIDDKAASQVALGRLVRMVWLVPSMDRLWIEGPEGRRRFLDRMTMSFEPDHAEAVLTYERRCANATACCASRCEMRIGIWRWKHRWRPQVTGSMSRARRRWPRWVPRRPRPKPPFRRPIWS